jgi:GT2 family glycosyltransferase
VDLSPSIAIVILNYNGQHYLEKFLPSVTASTYANKKIIIGDNASTDESLSWLKATWPGIEVIKNDNNYGFAKGYNEVLKKVSADYFVLLNSDVEVTPGWIEPVIDLMEKDPLTAACQPKLLAYNEKAKFEYAGAAGGWLDSLGYPFSRGRVFDYCEADDGRYDSSVPIFWASGAALFIRSALYKSMEGFDEYFFAHQEEIDLCWRLQLAGYSIMACPKSVVYHVGGGTLPKGGRKVYLNFRNNLVMVAKNWTSADKLWKLPLRIALDAISAWKALASGDSSFFMAVLKAHLSFLQWIFSNKNLNNFPVSRSGRVNGYYRGSVVWEYFIKKRKTFDEIVNKTQ